jgi:hypothetical protein
MLNFIKKIFGGKPTEVEVPYKVETPVAPTLVPKAEEKTTPKAKKPTVKKATTAKPKKPKTPKA